MESKNPFTEAIGSKRFLVSSLASILSYFSLRDGMPLDQVAMIVAPLSVYVGTLGLTGLGKEKGSAS